MMEQRLIGKKVKQVIDENTRLEELGLSVRPFNILYRAGIKTVEDLVKKTEREVMELRNMGKHSFCEITEKMDELGLTFKGIKNVDDEWIPIGDAKPPIGVPLIVTIRDNLEHKPNELRYPVYYEKDHIQQGYTWNWRYGDFNYQFLPDVTEVVAYMELPKAYESEEMCNG